MSFSPDTLSAVDRSILEALQELIIVVAQLRDPEKGCPWDLAQTPQTLVPYVIEEAYEVAAAIRSEQQDAIVEELGDLLLQVVLQSQVASDAGAFNLEAVARGITQKLIRRHPHVFGDLVVDNAEQVHANWEQIKVTEKGETPELAQRLSRKLEKYAHSLPPLLAGFKISQKAAAAGFEWQTADGVWDKFREELAEFETALQEETTVEQQAELGDLLFTLVNIARWYGLNPSEALHGTNQRFVHRLEAMEAFTNRPLSDHTLDELEQLWQEAKAELARVRAGKT
ncbi:MazG family protein [Rubidibacter lacunae KORDI 51-2]|uniref:MazG family protein n=1 Tax=Rubidibacter lacunae KORDI 51-2 TaxID=582515 RepID=U5DP58_9CHRO|nr:nucleoside triphosphate pyrophosphohydrolase [Rubidibacter lacunae]ERN42612.1 MazG family protein [Rubidibacter lacunae KORDI 51-2]